VEHGAHFLILYYPLELGSHLPKLGTALNWVVRVGSGAADDGARLSTRARLLLELVVDIKNNTGKAGAAR
jgi:hypothetical protein